MSGAITRWLLLSRRTRRSKQATIELHHEDQARTVQSDNLGRLTFHDVPAGSIRLTCRFSDEHETVVQAEWMII